MQKAVEWVEEGYLDALQVHGPENKDLVQRYTVPLYPVMNPKSPEEAESLSSSFFSARGSCRDGFRRLCREVPAAGYLTRFYRCLKSGKPAMLAGGLRPESHPHGIGNMEPGLVDVASGLESAPGKKDPERIKRFFEEVESVRQSCRLSRIFWLLRRPLVAEVLRKPLMIGGGFPYLGSIGEFQTDTRAA